MSAIKWFAISLIPALVQAADYKVTITNNMRHQTLSPPVVVIHGPAFKLYARGTTATQGIALMAEDGITSTLVKEINANKSYHRAMVGTGGIAAGQKRELTFRIDGKKLPMPQISFVSMITTTNDAFVAVSALALPASGRVEKIAPAYDAGSEENTELCIHVPGMPCDSHNVRRPSPGGKIALLPGPGILGIGDISSAMFGWDDAPATISIERIK